jgi:hypothetical protein
MGKISEMTDASALTGTEQIPAVQSGANVKLTPAQLETYLNLGNAAAKDVGTGAGDVAAGDHNHSGIYAPALGSDDNYVTDAEKSALHAHTNKATLDKFSESGGAVLYDGDPIAADKKIVFGTEITADADITATNHKFKTTDVNKSTAVTLTLKKNVFAVGEWFVLVQTGDGQFTLNGESGVTVPAWKKSAGKGFEMYVYCVDATEDANVFRIVGGVE